MGLRVRAVRAHRLHEELDDDRHGSGLSHQPPRWSIISSSVTSAEAHATLPPLLLAASRRDAGHRPSSGKSATVAGAVLIAVGGAMVLGSIGL